jgi:hypothetical protein
MTKREELAITEKQDMAMTTALARTVWDLKFRICLVFNA